MGRELPKFANYILDGKQSNETGWRNVKLNQAFHTNFSIILDISPKNKYEYKKSMNSMIEKLPDFSSDGAALKLAAFQGWAVLQRTLGRDNLKWLCSQNRQSRGLK